MLETKFVDQKFHEKFATLMTILTRLGTNIPYLSTLALDTNIKKSLPRSYICLQHLKNGHQR